MTNIKAELIYYASDEIQNRYILEMTIYWVGVSERYRDGIKYGFILVDPYSDKRVLYETPYRII